MPYDRCDRCQQGEPTRNPELPSALFEHIDDEEGAYADLSSTVSTYWLCEKCARALVWWWQSGKKKR